MIKPHLLSLLLGLALITAQGLLLLHPQQHLDSSVTEHCPVCLQAQVLLAQPPPNLPPAVFVPSPGYIVPAVIVASPCGLTTTVHARAPPALPPVKITIA